MVHLIKKDGIVVGWEMRPTTDEEHRVAAQVRDLQFFGFEDTAIEYNGLKLKDESAGKKIGNIDSISWIQKAHNV